MNKNLISSIPSIQDQSINQSRIHHVQRVNPSQLDSYLKSNANSQNQKKPLGISIVIDVFRATSTAAMLIHKGVKDLFVVGTPDELERLSGSKQEYVVFSEVTAAREYGFQVVDNSPAIALEKAKEIEKPVLVTTNGTRALKAVCPYSDQILLGSFMNLDKTVRYLKELSPPCVSLIPAGHFETGEPRVEDEACADAFEALLTACDEDLSLTELLEKSLNDDRIQRRLEKKPHLYRDIQLALSPNICNVVVALHQPTPLNPPWVFQRIA